MSIEKSKAKAKLSVQNVGGIDTTEVAFESGVTILTGRNATNRTSLLQAVMAALGSDDVSIKADTDEAHVELRIDGKTYTRTLKRQNETIATSGSPYLEDPTLGDLFSFLLESNELRRAVLTDGNLRDLIMRPIDTDEIQAEIEELLAERRQVSEELANIEDLKSELPTLEQKRTRLRDEIKETQAELEDLEADIDAKDADVDESREEQAELEEKLEELRNKRSTVEDTRYKLETEQESLGALRQEKQEIEEAYEELPDTPAGDLSEIQSRIDQYRTQKQELEAELNELQSVIGFNQDMIEDSADALDDALSGDSEGAVTDELVPDETVSCWTCGSEVSTDQIESTIEKLQKLSQETVSEINDIDTELNELQEKERNRKQQQQEKERLERRRQEIESELETTEERIEELSSRRDASRDEVQTIEAEVEQLQEDDAYEEVMELHKEANQLEYELGRLESDLEQVEDEIAEIECRLDDPETLEKRREEINNEIETLRTRIENIEQQTIEMFNDHMNAVLDLLEYKNIDRIWLERREIQVQEGRRKVSKSIFDLHVIRQTDSGTTYEDTINNLSESEREVTGLIFALAGYLAHDVHETVPFILLDSLEAIDSKRIASLIEYVQEYSEYLVVALLPEDASALPEQYQRVTEI